MTQVKKRYSKKDVEACTTTTYANIDWASLSLIVLVSVCSGIRWFFLNLILTFTVSALYAVTEYLLCKISQSHFYYATKDMVLSKIIRCKSNKDAEFFIFFSISKKVDKRTAKFLWMWKKFWTVDDSRPLRKFCLLPFSRFLASHSV